MINFQSDQKKLLLQLLFFLYAPLFVTLLVYWPGLTGPFLFDDIENFKSLMKGGHDNTLDRLYYFIMTGNAGPLGRPISLLSFIINDNAWPSSPWSFKYTNMLIHMLNGCLIFILTLQLSKFTNINKDYRYFFAGIVMSIWLLHPIQSSTVLYVIQRMTQLSTLFMLSAITSFLYGRTLLFNSNNTVKAYIIMSFGVIIFGTLAAFSKENGALVFLFIATIEYTLCSNNQQTTGYKYWRHIFVNLPSLLLIAVFIINYKSFQSAYSIRDFTMYERVLTETRILCDYLFQTIIPRSGGTGVFHDDYLKSSGLLSPPQTLVSIIAISALLISGITFRKKHRILSFSILWFFSGHAMESTIIPLELYFEHRNYLPILGPIFLFSSIALKVSHHLIKSNILVFIYICLMTLITYDNNIIWGNKVLAAKVWALEKPNSIRAQQAASDLSIKAGDYKKAREYIANIHHKYPNNTALALQLALLDCDSKQLTKQQLDSTITTLTHGTYSQATVPTLVEFYALMKNKPCSVMSFQKILDIINALLENNYYKSNSNLHILNYWKGIVHADMHQLNPAMESLDLAGKYLDVVDIPLQQAVWLTTAGLYDEALEYINKAKLVNKKARLHLIRDRRSKDIENLRSLIIKKRLEDNQQE